MANGLFLTFPPASGPARGHLTSVTDREEQVLTEMLCSSEWNGTWPWTTLWICLRQGRVPLFGSAAGSAAEGVMSSRPSTRLAVRSGSAGQLYPQVHGVLLKQDCDVQVFVT